MVFYFTPRGFSGKDDYLIYMVSRVRPALSPHPLRCLRGSPPCCVPLAPCSPSTLHWVRQRATKQSLLLRSCLMQGKDKYENEVGRASSTRPPFQLSEPGGCE